MEQHQHRKKKKRGFLIMISAVLTLLVLAGAGIFYCSTVGSWNSITYFYGGDQRIPVESAVAEEVNLAFREALEGAEVTVFGKPEETVYGGVFFLADWKPVTCQGDRVQIGFASYQLTEEGEEKVAQALEQLAAYCGEQTEGK